MIHCFSVEQPGGYYLSGFLFDQYEKIPGQKANYDKSLIIFGKRIPQNIRPHIQQILKISTLGGGGKYLGLPEQFS